MIQIPDKDKWDARVKILSKMSRQQLALMVTRLARKQGDQWLIGGPNSWSRDELINYILECEGLQFDLPVATPCVPTPELP